MKTLLTPSPQVGSPSGRVGHLARNFRGKLAAKTTKNKVTLEEVKPKVSPKSMGRTRTKASKFNDYLVTRKSGYDENVDEDPDDPDQIDQPE